MAEAVLENNYRRQFAGERAQSISRLRDKDALDRAKKEAFEKAAKLALDTARRWAVRRIAWAFGATLVGLVVTYLIWTGQFILGNWLKNEGVPTLEWWEVGIWFCFTILIIAIIIISIILLIIIILVSLGPVAGLIYFGPGLFAILKDRVF